MKDEKGTDESVPPAVAGGLSRAAEVVIPDADIFRDASCDFTVSEKAVTTNQHEKTRNSDRRPTDNEPTRNPRSAIPDPQLEEWEEADFQKPVWLEAEQPSDDPPEPVPRARDVEGPPKPRSIYDLKRGIDAYGREIFIESEWPNGKPELWYQQDRKGNYLRFDRDGFGVIIKQIGSSPFL